MYVRRVSSKHRQADTATSRRPPSPRRARAVSLALALLLSLSMTPLAPATSSGTASSPLPDRAPPGSHADGLVEVSPRHATLPPSASASTASLGTLAANELFASGFEVWPGPWSMGSPSGPTWGQTSYRKSAGTYSAYCAGSAITAPGPYANDMFAWMVAGPFDLTGHDTGSFTFDLWLDCEQDHDGLLAGVSADGSSFATRGWTGNSDGWYAVEIDLADVHGDGAVDFTGEPTVWIAFIFVSDESVTGEGAYVDNVRVTAEVATPNTPPVANPDSYQTAYETPLVVPAPGVLSNDTDAEDDTLTASKVGDPSNGTVTLNANGGFTYTPNAGFHGVDTFTYRAHDGRAYSNTTDVDVTVAPPLPPVLEVAGGTRYETAIEASKLAYPGTASTVVIATGMNWPDALGGSALAGVLDGPILLTEPGSLPAAVRTEIRRLGAHRAVILGGYSAVSAGVESALRSEVGSVDRIAGSDRYDTANRVARRVITELGASFDGRAFVSTGGNFPDALAAAPLAAANGWPLYLANPTTGLSGATKTAMAGVNEVIILGGTAAVSSAVQSDLSGAFSVSRLAGSNRYDTACKVAAYGVNSAGLGWNRAGIATGMNYPDALAGGVLQGKVGSVMLLTPSNILCHETGETLYTKRSSISTVTFFGGTGALTQSVRNDVIAALAGSWSPPSPPGSVQNGVWHGFIDGTTYEAVTLNVRNNMITREGSTLPQGASMIVKYPYSNVTMVAYVYQDIPITNGAFSHTWGTISSVGGRKQVSGTFTSASTVVGTASHDENSTAFRANMSYKWNATR